MATVPRPDRDTLRRLSEVDAGGGSVLSVYVNLDPSEFATADARASAIGSAVNAAAQAVEDDERELSHDQRIALREDVELVRDYLESADFGGTEGVAVFAAGHADLFEALQLPFPVDNAVVVDAAPHVAPLTFQSEGDWYVALVNRADARFLRGGPQGLTEEGRVSDDVHGQHDQGGWSQARYERSVDREADEHVRALLDTLRRLHERRGFDHLLVVAGPEVWAWVEHGLHAELREIFAGRVDADIPGASPEEVLAVVRPEMHRVREQHERELLARLEERLGRGERAAAGLQPTLDALLQGRVETLLLLDGLAASGVVCAGCGWMGADPDTAACPVDGERPERRDDIVEAAIASALGQDADVVRIVGDDPPAEGQGPPARVLQLQGHGSIAALLRF
ncbi:MAG TPA: Vms1/Ankzf1 family peptidyl-tRNA hydrolase [Thermoleophilaceae bacterium]|nr:Vms1/Ankzf1 family peptidyl-tRNA hydrolase [Thermoleophilaceae bacterium]